jgi:hypothetical protein
MRRCRGGHRPELSKTEKCLARIPLPKGEGGPKGRVRGEKLRLFTPHPAAHLLMVHPLPSEPVQVKAGYASSENGDGRKQKLRSFVSVRVVSTSGCCQFQQVMRGADQTPLGGDFGLAAE